MRHLLSAANPLILCILGNDETTHHGKYTRLFLLVGTFDPEREEMQLKKTALFVPQYYVSALCMEPHDTTVPRPVTSCLEPCLSLAICIASHSETCLNGITAQ